MKTFSLFLIILVILVLIILFGGVLIVHTSKVKLGKKILKKSASLFSILSFGCLLIYSTTRPYSFYLNQNLWSEYGLAQIDSMMYLSYHKSNSSNYSSMSRDSVRHLSKTTQYDLFDIYSIVDEFANLKQEKLLKIRFIKPNVMRDSSRLMTLEHSIEYANKSMIDTLSISQFDSVLVDWGLRENIYVKLLRYDK